MVWPDGVALVTSEMNITWANRCMRTWSTFAVVRPRTFTPRLGTLRLWGRISVHFTRPWPPEIPAAATLQTADFTYYQVHVAPLPGAASDQAALVATVSDITAEIVQQQKLAAIHQAGQN